MPPATAVRILPMSARAPGFTNKDIPQVQRDTFLQDLPKNAGRFRYRLTGLNAPANTIILFQYRAHVIALATFVRDEKFTRPKRGHRGAIHLDPASIRTFIPVDAAQMRQAWPAFRAFGHVKQVLNAAGYPAFRRRLKSIRRPAADLMTTRPSPPTPYDRTVRIRAARRAPAQNKNLPT